MSDLHECLKKRKLNETAIAEAAGALSATDYGKFYDTIKNMRVEQFRDLKTAISNIVDASLKHKQEKDISPELKKALADVQSNARDIELLLGKIRLDRLEGALLAVRKIQPPVKQPKPWGPGYDW